MGLKGKFRVILYGSVKDWNEKPCTLCGRVRKCCWACDSLEDCYSRFGSWPKSGVDFITCPENGETRRCTYILMKMKGVGLL